MDTRASGNLVIGSASGPVLVVAAHPDDEVLGCGGTMAAHVLAGRSVHVLLMTDGVGARARDGSSAKDATNRAEAARRAAAILGVHEPRMKSYPDNAMDTCPLLDVIRVVEASVNELQPTTVYTHHRGDLNIDHEIVHRAVLAACRPQPGHPVREIYSFPVRSSTEWAGPSPGTIFAPSMFVDISHTLEEKMKALAAYGVEMCEPPHSRPLEAVEAQARVDVPRRSLSRSSGSCGQVMNEKSYLVAGSRPWNREVFDRRIRGLPGDWVFVDRPDVLTPQSVGDLDPRYLFFLHWSTKVPDEITQRYECVNFHMTDVPFGRGGSPLQNLIARGHTSTMLTALRMSDELDAGPVYMKRPLSLEGRAEEIYVRMTRLAAEMIEAIIREEPAPRPQEGEVVVFERRRPQQSEIARTGSLDELHDFIRMLDADGYPRAFLVHRGYRYEFSSSARHGEHLEARVVVTRDEPRDTP